MNPSPPPPLPPPSQPLALPSKLLPRREPTQPFDQLVFSPLAWLKLIFFLHAGDTEIGGFAISAEDNPLYIEQFVTVDQNVSSVTVEFSDESVADYFDQCVDAGLKPDRFARIWCHTHPGESPHPSGTDEITFDRVFGRCDWSVMFIIGRTGRIYARLAFAAGPRGHVLLPVTVDWEAWSQQVLEAQLDAQLAKWEAEFDAHVHPVRFTSFQQFGNAMDVLPATSGRTLLNRSGDNNRDRLSWWDYEEYEPRQSHFDVLESEDHAFGHGARDEVRS